MKRIYLVFVVIIILFSFYHIARFVNDNKAWEKVKNNNTPEAYDFYSKHFKYHLSEVEPLREKSVISLIEREASFKDIENYFRRYGTYGCCYKKYCESVKKIILRKNSFKWYDFYLQLPELKEGENELMYIRKLSDISLWDSIKKDKNWEDYLQKFPNGNYHRVALQNIENEVWEKALKSNSIYLLDEYLKDYPNGRYKEIAKSNIHELEWSETKENNSMDKYESFLYKYPNSKYYYKALKGLENSFVNELLSGICHKSIPDKIKKYNINRLSGGWSSRSFQEWFFFRENNNLIVSKDVARIKGMWLRSGNKICMTAEWWRKCKIIIFEVLNETKSKMKVKCLSGCTGTHILNKRRD